MEAVLIALGLLAALVLYVNAVVDIHRHRFPTLRDKSTWLSIVIMMPVVGPLLYFGMYKRKQEKAQQATRLR